MTMDILERERPTTSQPAKASPKIATANSEKTGAKLVVSALEAQGVTHVWGIPGAKIDAVFDALVDSKIKTVVCRHEQNAAFIAGGIGRAMELETAVRLKANLVHMVWEDGTYDMVA